MIKVETTIKRLQENLSYAKSFGFAGVYLALLKAAEKCREQLKELEREVGK